MKRTGNWKKVKFKLIAPEKALSIENARSVFLPGLEGELEVLDGHVPYVVLLKAGRITVVSNGSTETFDIEGGMADIDQKNVNVLSGKTEKKQ